MPRNPYSTRPTHQADLLLWISTRPQGATIAEIRAGMAWPATSKATHAAFRLFDMGRLGFIVQPKAPGARGHATVRRYFERSRCPAGATIAIADLQLMRGSRAAGAPQPMTVRPKKSGASQRPQGEAITPPGVLTEHLSGFVPNARFQPDRVEPFFSAGLRVSGETWATHYLGARR